MGRNVKPILSVLIDEEKRDRFRRLADENKLSMGWLLNDCIDRMLEANSIDIYKTSIGDTDTSPKSEGVAVSQSSIEEMIKTYVDSRLQNISIGNTDTKDIEEILKTYVDGTVKESIGSMAVPIERLRDEIEEQIKELETFTRSQLEAMRGEIKKSECDRLDGQEAIAVEPISATTQKFMRLEVAKFKQDPEFLKAVKNAIAPGKSNAEVVDLVFKSGYGASDNTKPYNHSYVARWRNAIAYIEKNN